MTVVKVIRSRRERKYWASLDCSNKRTAPGMREYLMYNKRAFHYYNGDIQGDNPLAVVWIDGPYFQNCKVFLLRRPFRLPNYEWLISNPGCEYRVEGERTASPSVEASLWWPSQKKINQQEHVFPTWREVKTSASFHRRNLYTRPASPLYVDASWLISPCTNKEQNISYAVGRPWRALAVSPHDGPKHAACTMMQHYFPASGNRFS
ncbi:hypothetical protein TESG_01677 [Trichophyton tonsurans CBS 112818]|uniref:Uncharacterized protein n=2 Tax=Trichophyton TaxID=5550 RepID=F2Q186_TRIEC|nr:hypothetical protein TESG_01677 [Trichophyton tonsurans CBS 112818]EGE07904.1 hypothetical protein TEQG_06936 [Trichophyton equinum CBS 127.97]